MKKKTWKTLNKRLRKQMPAVERIVAFLGALTGLILGIREIFRWFT